MRKRERKVGETVEADSQETQRREGMGTERKKEDMKTERE